VPTQNCLVSSLFTTFNGRDSSTEISKYLRNGSYSPALYGISSVSVSLAPPALQQTPWNG
jgi:hypothetical protein